MKDSGLTCQELYDLAWLKPMTQLAQEFGLPAAEIRKHCTNHDIPTPAAGYWTKVARDKIVTRPLLPVGQSPSTEVTSLSLRDADRLAQRDIDKAAGVEVIERWRVPASLPDQLHSLTRKVRAALRKARRNEKGFKSLIQSDAPEICVGPDSVARLLPILNTLFCAVEELGHKLDPGGDQFHIVVNGERLRIRLYEIQAQVPHEPTKSELTEQADYERRRQRNPDWYKDRKVYRKWDHIPSGRLTMELRDTNYRNWQKQALVQRWRDRNGRVLEDCMPSILKWMESASDSVRETRLYFEEKQRKGVEETMRRQQARDRYEKAEKLEKLLVQFADVQERLSRTHQLIESVQARSHGGGAPTQRLLEEAMAYAEHLTAQLDDANLAARFSEIDILVEEGVLIPALAEPPTQARYRWDRWGV